MVWTGIQVGNEKSRPVLTAKKDMLLGVVLAPNNKRAAPYQSRPFSIIP